MKELVEIEETYDKDGFLIKMTANGTPLFIPVQKFPTVKIANFSQDVEWIMQKRTLTKQEFENLYHG